MGWEKMIRQTYRRPFQESNIFADLQFLQWSAFLQDDF
jgi:hypothetical protein